MGAVVGLALVVSGSGVWVTVGAAVLVFSVLTNPAKWWRYVRTGARAETPVPAEFVEPGVCSVELRSPGDRPIETIKGLREVTGAGFAEAKSRVQDGPVVVAKGLSVDSAARVRDRLARAGATAVVRTDADEDPA